MHTNTDKQLPALPQATGLELMNFEDLRYARHL